MLHLAELIVGSPLFVMKSELCNQAEELIGNPNVLVNIISTRVRQLNTGGARPLIDSPLLGAADLALTELVEGKMDYELTGIWTPVP